jgi:hypothetical protein
MSAQLARANIERTQLITAADVDDVERRHALLEESWELGHALDEAAGP